MCGQRGPKWSAEEIRNTPLRSVTLPQLVAVHVMSLDDDCLRHFVPRLTELMLHTPSPVFDFRLADLKCALAGAVWSELPTGYPPALGYFSDCPSALDLLDWLRDPAVGQRLEHAFYAADSPDAAQQLSAAHELWMVCVTT